MVHSYCRRQWAHYQELHYLDIFPYINKPTMLCEFDEMGEAAIIYHILALIGCLLLLLLVIRTARRGKKKKTAARKPATPQIIEVRSDTDFVGKNSYYMGKEI